MFEKYVEDFRKNGFVLIPNFLDEKTVDEVKNTIHRMIEGFDVKKEKLMTDSTEKPNYNYTNFGDKTGFFFEDKALDEDGNLKYDKHRSIFRIGLALHVLEPTFQKLTYSDKVKQLIKEVGFGEPRVVQGMYIFKNPEIGGQFLPHQDVTYLHTIPDTKLLGVWMPMEDANEENGTLYFIPGSHKTGLHRQLVRDGEGNNWKFTTERPDYKDQDFVPVIAPKGSCVLLDGLVVHKSAPNRSQKGRPVYTFHLYDHKSSKWNPENWLQPTAVNPFPALYS